MCLFGSWVTRVQLLSELISRVKNRSDTFLFFGRYLYSQDRAYNIYGTPKMGDFNIDVIQSLAIEKRSC